MSQFWKGWLDVWCYLVIIFGALLAGAGLEQTGGPAHMLFTALNPEVGASFNGTERFAIGLMGSVTIGWGLTLFYMIRAAHKYGPPLWSQISIVALVWYVVDGYISYITGFGLNIVSNTVLIAGLLLPIYAGR